eukprot:TRINITY_DN527_c0_g1_i1.p1 TRINITY_DN527_c0_g1~~TRINITY_DN527_c0_g1_i1.p1  ORF type:complete len:196 (-),score=44.78 TRINITY_DN527_c0_g1_i1:1054-1641(-)
MRRPKAMAAALQARRQQPQQQQQQPQAQDQKRAPLSPVASEPSSSSDTENGDVQLHEVRKAVTAAVDKSSCSIVAAIDRQTRAVELQTVLLSQVLARSSNASGDSNSTKLVVLSRVCNAEGKLPPVPDVWPLEGLSKVGLTSFPPVAADSVTYLKFESLAALLNFYGASVEEGERPGDRGQLTAMGKHLLRLLCQ